MEKVWNKVNILWRADLGSVLYVVLFLLKTDVAAASCGVMEELILPVCPFLSLDLSPSSPNFFLLFLEKSRRIKVWPLKMTSPFPTSRVFFLTERERSHKRDESSVPKPSEQPAAYIDSFLTVMEPHRWTDLEHRQQLTLEWSRAKHKKIHTHPIIRYNNQFLITSSYVYWYFLVFSELCIYMQHFCIFHYLSAIQFILAEDAALEFGWNKLSWEVTSLNCLQ